MIKLVCNGIAGGLSRQDTHRCVGHVRGRDFRSDSHGYIRSRGPLCQFRMNR